MLFQIEVTTHCNFQCFYCAGRDMKQEHMPWERFLSILAGVPDGDHVVSLQGEGEPTSHPRFWDMVDAVSARRLRPFTITNGSQVDPDLFNGKFPSIGVSIDTLDPAEADRIGRYKLNRVLENVDALADAMGASRIHIMTVDYGQPLEDVRRYAAARGFGHSVTPLMPKEDYARRYAAQVELVEPQYTYRCRYLEQPLRRYYDIAAREYPCCYIKDARLHEPIEAMRAKMARRELPAACVACPEVLSDATPPRVRRAATAAAVRYSIVTICKGRLAHLQQSLPRFATQANAEVIVVDYDCPDRAGDWAAAQVPGARVIRVGDAPFFNAARARNAGGAAARGEWICFVDPDVLVDDGFTAGLDALLRPGHYYSGGNERRGLVGTAICRRADFLAVDGYDEVLEGWGHEDIDFYLRLEILGLRRAPVPASLLEPIQHGDDLRARFFRGGNRATDNRINSLYVQAKRDLLCVQRKANLQINERRRLYAATRDASDKAGADGRMMVGVTLPSRPVARVNPGWTIGRQWEISVKKDPGPGGQPGGHERDAAHDARQGLGHAVKDVPTGDLIDALYGQIKHDLLMENQAIDPHFLRAIHGKVRSQILALGRSGQGRTTFRIQLGSPLSVRLNRGSRMQRVWTFTLAAQPAAVPGGT